MIILVLLYSLLKLASFYSTTPFNTFCRDVLGGRLTGHLSEFQRIGEACGELSNGPSEYRDSGSNHVSGSGSGGRLCEGCREILDAAVQSRSVALVRRSG